MKKSSGASVPAYDHAAIERKWQDYWERHKLFEAKEDPKKKKFYGLIEFPYPSGDGLHVGHPRPYIGMDVICRKRRMEGYEVLYPIGWDAFGLPTENYAIKTGISPFEATKRNTDNFRRQIKSLAISFDWSREINTTDPKYYKWTQWIFLKFFEKGLAYKKKMAINWCPKDKIGLANEEVVDGTCERCGTPVEKREKEQWMLAITKYADRLDKDLDDVNFLEKIKIQQRNWIGKSEGAELEFKLTAPSSKLTAIKVFTTRPDTLFGVTYLVVAPESEYVAELKSEIKNWSEVERYIKEAKKRSEIERTADEKEKTGVKLDGVFVINPANGEKVPVWIADYVLAGYGTGAVMAVPAHDERDFAFAKKYSLPIKEVVEPKFTNTTGDGAPEPDLPFVRREAVCAIVRNPKDGTYLCNSWKEFHMHGLFTGGIEEGEDIVETARREVLEETGYKNMKFVRTSRIAINTFFYHRVKKQNRHAHFRFVFFDLENDERAPVDEKEAAIHEIVWKKREELKDFFTVFEGEFIVNILDSDDYVNTEAGIMANSDGFDSMESEKAKKLIAEKFGTPTVTYKLRDWVFSRQRYWGEPIPMVRCEKDGWVPVPEKDLPVTLPEVAKYEPTDTGESPLALISDWVNTTCPTCGGPAKRETDTMPNWAGSSWYYLRYCDPHDDKTFADMKHLKYWTPVDWYNGGMEHTTLHLLYSRFWHKFLYDLKLVPTSEPYMKRTSHGLILGETGEKMSKSRGNVVNPDDIVKNVGADSLRVYEMFMGPFDQPIAWNSDSIAGARRFIEKVWKLQDKVSDNAKDGEEAVITLNQTIKKVSDGIEAMSFNTAISAMMILANALESAEAVSTGTFGAFIQILSPFAPHVAEELWANLGNTNSILEQPWPAYDESKLTASTVKIAVQVNGKVRATVEMPADAPADEVERAALADPQVVKWVGTGKIVKKVFVKNKIVNFVVA